MPTSKSKHIGQMYVPQQSIQCNDAHLWYYSELTGLLVCNFKNNTCIMQQTIWVNFDTDVSLLFRYENDRWPMLSYRNPFSLKMAVYSVFFRFDIETYCREWFSKSNPFLGSSNINTLVCAIPDWSKLIILSLIPCVHIDN